MPFQQSIPELRHPRAKTEGLPRRELTRGSSISLVEDAPFEHAPFIEPSAILMLDPRIALVLLARPRMTRLFAWSKHIMAAPARRVATFELKR